MGAKHFGARVKRLEDPSLLAGRGRFVDDMKLPGLLHACFVRSPHAHAKLVSIDSKVAMIMPGVHAVITAEDLPEPLRSMPMPMLLPNPAITAAPAQYVLARQEVSYVGQPVAVRLQELVNHAGTEEIQTQETIKEGLADRRQAPGRARRVARLLGGVCLPTGRHCSSQPRLVIRKVGGIGIPPCTRCANSGSW